MFKLSEAAEKLGLEGHVLRYWEKEFSFVIRPIKIGSRKRLYRQEDLLMFQTIKDLLYNERFTIEGAKKKIAQATPRTQSLFPDDSEESLTDLQLLSTPRILSDDPRELKEIILQIRLELLGLREYLMTSSRGKKKSSPEASLADSSEADSSEADSPEADSLEADSPEADSLSDSLLDSLATGPLSQNPPSNDS
ncbi:MAG: MerR family transcriptional regulator [Deltaproteobacteria bacterium]|nr:MerR family transcriptional regulator [Deltaproteobacteria bacterium]